LASVRRSAVDQDTGAIAILGRGSRFVMLSFSTHGSTHGIHAGITDGLAY